MNSCLILIGIPWDDSLAGRGLESEVESELEWS